MTRHRALTSTLRSVIALFTALVVAVIGATALPTAALAGGNGHAKGHQSDRADKGSDRSNKPGKAHKSQKPAQQKSQKPAQQKSQKPAQQKSQKPAHQKSQKPAQHKGADKGTKGGKGGKGDPPGNNGTVKIAHLNENDGTPNNNPHVGCSFQIEWYGFDKGDDIISTVNFAAHSPTSDVTISGTSPEKVFVGGDSASGAGTDSGLDGVQVYTLSFDGEPHPKQGYHVKLTVHTPYSQGSDRKHKVFWVEPCEEDVPEDDEGEVPDDDDDENDDDENEDDDNGDQDEADDDDGVQDQVNENDETRTEVRGVQSSRSSAAARSSAPAAEVPTAVDSGLTDEEWSRSVLPFLAVLLGLATSFVALMRRRARVQTVSSD